MRLDSHQHFWRYDPSEHVWMTDRMDALKRDFLPADLEPLLQKIDFAGCIAVQARQNLKETRWLLQLAREHPFIAGVVGWVDLRSGQVESQLAEFASHPKLVGVRHVVHDEPDDHFMLGADFQRGISHLREFGLTYDLLLFPQHLPVAVKLVEKFPDQPFVLDHIAKPPIAEGALSPWREDLRELAKFPRVCCKLSGLVTEAKWRNWKAADFAPYFDTVLEAFGPGRLMIGSDWPVCTLSAGYETTMRLVIDYVNGLGQGARAGILGGNCSRFYPLPAAVPSS